MKIGIVQTPHFTRHKCAADQYVYANDLKCAEQGANLVVYSSTFLHAGQYYYSDVIMSREDHQVTLSEIAKKLTLPTLIPLKVNDATRDFYDCAYLHDGKVSFLFKEGNLAEFGGEPPVLPTVELGETRLGIAPEVEFLVGYDDMGVDVDVMLYFPQEGYSINSCISQGFIGRYNVSLLQYMRMINATFVMVNGVGADISGTSEGGTYYVGGSYALSNLGTLYGYLPLHKSAVKVIDIEDKAGPLSSAGKKSKKSQMRPPCLKDGELLHDVLVGYLKEFVAMYKKKGVHILLTGDFNTCLLTALAAEALPKDRIAITYIDDGVREHKDNARELLRLLEVDSVPPRKKITNTTNAQEKDAERGGKRRKGDEHAKEHEHARKFRTTFITERKSHEALAPFSDLDRETILLYGAAIAKEQAKKDNYLYISAQDKTADFLGLITDVVQIADYALFLDILRSDLVQVARVSDEKRGVLPEAVYSTANNSIPKEIANPLVHDNADEDPLTLVDAVLAMCTHSAMLDHNIDEESAFDTGVLLKIAERLFSDVLKRAAHPEALIVNQDEGADEVLGNYVDYLSEAHDDDDTDDDDVDDNEVLNMIRDLVKSGVMGESYQEEFEDAEDAAANDEEGLSLEDIIEELGGTFGLSEGGDDDGRPGGAPPGFPFVCDN